MGGKLVVIKVGGSLITDKSKPLSLRKIVLNRVARELAHLTCERRLVVIHGGGSYGHFVVQKMRGSSQLELLAEVRYWMSLLNLEVVGAFIRHSIPAVGLPPLTLVEVESGEVCRVDTELLARLLELGAIPVSHGDVVLDKASGLTILSGDVLAREIAVRMSADALVFLMDVNGVYTEDPHSSPNARLIRYLTRDEAERIGGGGVGVDVTGGIRLKLVEALRAAEAGVRVALGGIGELRAMVLGLEGQYTMVKP